MRKPLKRLLVIALSVATFWGIFHWLGLAGDHPVGETTTSHGISDG